EHRFPAAVEDAYVALQWVMDNAGDVNGDPERVAVVGESAGGNLAAVVSQIARDRGDPMPVHQVLVYPVAQMISDSTPSYETYANAVPLNREAMHWFIQRYLQEPEDANDPYASPLLADDLSGLPGATVITAEIDPLRSEGEAYAVRLQEAGVDVTYQNFPGVTHEFFGMGAVLPEARDAV
ncbi:MAG: alpha/beta hydrolase, partial [Caldilineaceae bacterium]|nr:alpha/beta hydrolase [Caldilineaceae bacterium]